MNEPRRIEEVLVNLFVFDHHVTQMLHCFIEGLRYIIILITFITLHYIFSVLVKNIGHVGRKLVSKTDFYHLSASSTLIHDSYTQAENIVPSNVFFRLFNYSEIVQHTSGKRHDGRHTNKQIVLLFELCFYNDLNEGCQLEQKQLWEVVMQEMINQQAVTSADLETP